MTNTNGVSAKKADVVCAQNFFRRKGTKPILQVTVSCSELATDIDICLTTYGKKVLLSIGGGGQSIIFNAASGASAFGGILWDLFGPPDNVDINLRPFGDVSVDGFDIGKELAASLSLTLSIPRSRM